MVALLSMFVPRFRKFHAAGKGHADDLSEDEFFDQKSGGEREGQPAENYQSLQPRLY
jgi:hypothetical protein